LPEPVVIRLRNQRAACAGSRFASARISVDDALEVDPPRVAVDAPQRGAQQRVVVGELVDAGLDVVEVDAGLVVLVGLLRDGVLGRVPGVRRLEEAAAHAGEVAALDVDRRRGRRWTRCSRLGLVLDGAGDALAEARLGARGDRLDQAAVAEG
jgi:hypothetical protein